MKSQYIMTQFLNAMSNTKYMSYKVLSCVINNWWCIIVMEYNKIMKHLIRYIPTSPTESSTQIQREAVDAINTY